MICEQFSRRRTSYLATEYLYTYLLRIFYCVMHFAVNLIPKSLETVIDLWYMLVCKHLYLFFLFTHVVWIIYLDVSIRGYYPIHYRRGKSQMCRDSNCIRYYGDSYFVHRWPNDKIKTYFLNAPIMATST